MDLLVLGGTAYLGRAIAVQARDRGIDVTCLARGTSPAPGGVGFVTGDRDSADGLAGVAGGHWDAVVDVSRQPGQVRRAVRELDTEHWVFVSSGNVYAAFDRLEQSEDAALNEPLDGDVMADMSQYGPAKVACENAVREASVSATIIRSGLIGGPGDWSGRTGYYPWRFAHPTAPDVLVPEDPDFPCALIDVDDLASWVVHCAAERVEGTFNATGPTTRLEEVLRAAREVAADPVAVSDSGSGSGSADGEPSGAGRVVPDIRWVPPDLLQREGIAAWMGPKSLPLWIDDPGWRYFATLDTSAARGQGLTTRPLEETLRRALDYEHWRDVPRQTGLTDDEERELRAAITG
ncbi:NAD-dependent epimerase/dehydratase family protein [Actinomycetota bacterium]